MTDIINIKTIEESTINKDEINTTPKLKVKKTKKKKKKYSFKKFLKNAMKSSKTDEERKKIHQQKIKESLGGGTFSKIDFI